MRGKIISLFVLFLIASIVFAQDFELEKIGDEEEEFEEEEEYWEEEYIEEEVLIEDKAGTTPDSPFYFVDEIVEDITLALKDGEEKAEYAMEIAEEKVAEAKLMAEKNKSSETGEALTKAKDISKIIEEEVSPGLEQETEEKMEFIKKILEEMEKEIPADWDEIKDLIDSQQSQAEKNQVAANLATKIGDLCEKLAMQDWEMMENEPRCNPDNAPDWLKEYIAQELTDREEEAKKEVIETMTQCMTDPRECDCSEIPIRSHRKMCEKATPLAIECEFEFNMMACDELDSLDMPDFSEVPDFLKGAIEKTFTEIIREKEKKMFDKFAPPECIEKGLTTKEECEELMHEIYGPPPEECMENGKFIGPHKCEKIMEEKYGPTPEECLDDERHFIGELECMEIIAPECYKKGIKKFDDCKTPGDHMGGGPMPPECIEAGITDGEECSALMEELYGPTDPACLDENGMYAGDEICIQATWPECAEAGGTTFEECEELVGGQEGGEGPPMVCIEDGDYIGMDACNEAMWDQSGRPPSECFEEGMFIGSDYCKALTGTEYHGAPPDECMSGSDFVGHDECKDIMGWGQEEDSPSPKECLDEIGRYIGDEECMKLTDPGCASLGATSWDDCHNIMREKYGMSPDECFEGEGTGFIGELKCAIIIENQYGGEDQRPGDYCYENGEYVGDDECSRRNDEMGVGSGGGHGTAPDYCFDENDEYIGDTACSAKNDEVQDEYVEDLYEEINNLEEGLESGEGLDDLIGDDGDWEEVDEEEELKEIEEQEETEEEPEEETEIEEEAEEEIEEEAEEEIEEEEPEDNE